LRGRDINRLIGAATVGTQYEDQFTIALANKVWVDNARSQWTSYQNLQQWFYDAKRDLIESGLCIDKEVRNGDGKLVLELNFCSEEVKRRILNIDETHHDLLITGERGGICSVMYHNPQLQRGSKRGVKSSRHVTSFYATSAAGESLHPMYIIDSGAKFDANFRVKMQWLEGLPNITGRFGCPSNVESSSFFAVQTRGSMDDAVSKHLKAFFIPFQNLVSLSVFIMLLF
jgi:hypothetical protein